MENNSKKILHSIYRHKVFYLYILLSIFFVVVFVFTTVTVYKKQTAQAAIATTDTDMYSSNMLLLDMSNHCVITESGSRDKIYPASLTKLMSVLVSIERLENTGGPDTKMTVPEDIFNDLNARHASMAGFSPGETVRAEDLLYGMMLPSGADAAIAMAVSLYGSEDVFVYVMNEKAKALGMTHTHFANATGLHDDQHYSTLEDLGKMLVYALQNDYFRKIFTTSVYETSKTAQHPEGILMESTLFCKMSVEAMESFTILGGKTGFTDKAGLCLATLASADQKEYMLITAGARGKTAASPFHIPDAIKIYSNMVRIKPSFYRCDGFTRT